MAARVIDLDSGQTWELFATPNNDASRISGSVWWRYRINRSSRADVTLSKPWISKHHGGIDFRDGQWWANDGGSIHPVTVNGVHSARDQALASGDVLGFGQTRLRFETDGLPPALPPPASETE